MRNSTFITSMILFLLFSTAAGAVAQVEGEPQEPETLVKSGTHNGWMFAPTNKLSLVDGDFKNFFGFRGGWIPGRSFLVGLAVYGTTNDTRVDMTYGGLLLEYFFDPNKLINYSVSGLIGGGGVDFYSHRGRHHRGERGFFAFEPGAQVTLNITKRLRFDVGAGYRFVGGDNTDLDLGGPTVTLSFKLGSF